MRYLLLFLMAFGLVAQIPGTFRVTGPVAPPATNSNFGATDTIYGKGGHVTGLTSLSEAQDVLRYPLARRQLGMHFTLTDGTTYQLQGSNTNFVNVTPIYTNAGVGYNIQLLETTSMEIVNADQITSDAFITGYDGVIAPNNYAMPKGWITARSTAIECYLTNILALTVLPTVESGGDTNGIPRDALVLEGDWAGIWRYDPFSLSDTNGANIRYPDSTTTNTTQGRWEFFSSTKTTKTVPTLATLLSTDPRELASEYVGTNTTFHALIDVAGYYEEGDGGGGSYVFTTDQSNTNQYGGKLAVLGGAWLLNDDVYSAKHFGAKGDGTTDDTIFLNSWAGYPFSKKELPFGEYKISARINFPNSNYHIDWYGKTKAADGVDYHQLYFGTLPTFSGMKPTPTVFNVSVDGHGIGSHDGNSLNAVEYFPGGATPTPYGGHGLYFSGISNVVCVGMSVSNAPTFAVSINGCVQGRFSRMYVDNGNGNNSAFYNGRNADGIHFADSEQMTISDSFVRSADDNYAITVNEANVGNYVLSNLRGIQAMAGNGDYRVIAFNARVRRDILGTVTNVVFNNCVFTGDQGGFIVDSNTTDPAVGSVHFNNVIWHDLVNTGTAAYPAKVFGGIGGAADIHFTGCTFTNIARYAFVQNATNISWRNCNFSQITTNYWTSTAGAILLDGDNSTSIGSIDITDCGFQNVDQLALRFVGLVSGSKKINGPITIAGNRFQNGGITATTSAGIPAISITGVSSLVECSDNVFVDWNGPAATFADVEKLSLNGNHIDAAGATVTNSYGLLIDYTAGQFGNRVSLKDNIIANVPGQGMLLRNYKYIHMVGNMFSGNGRINPAPSGVSIRILGDGAGNPVTTGWNGQIVGNLFTGTGTGTGLEFLVASAPTYIGSPLAVSQNQFGGYTTSISRDGLYSMPFVFSEPIVVGSTINFGASGQSVMRLSTTSAASNTNTAYISKDLTLSSSSSADQVVLRVPLSIAGTGGITGSANAISASASYDQTSGTASLVRAGLFNARLTSTGSVTLAESVGTLIQATGPGVIAEASQLRVSAPSISGGGTIGTLKGINILEQTASGVTNAYGIFQIGANDINELYGITRLNGSLRVGASGSALTTIKTGTGTLIAGVVTIADTSVTATSTIIPAIDVPGGTPGALAVTNKVANTSFQIVSDLATDTSTVRYILLNQ